MEMFSMNNYVLIFDIAQLPVFFSFMWTMSIVAYLIVCHHVDIFECLFTLSQTKLGGYILISNAEHIQNIAEVGKCCSTYKTLHLCFLCYFSYCDFVAL